ncbi:MAG: beta-lactamase family protein [Lysobacter sp.]|nr:beta-lactamase family protein [Lysobacter sp.]
MRLGIFSLLFTLTLGTTAQTPERMSESTAFTAMAPAEPAITLAAASLTTPTNAPVSITIPPAAPAKPLPYGFDVSLFESMASELVANQRVPGLAMAIVHNGQVLSARGYGITDVSAAEPVDGHTVFRLASLSKGFAGTMAGLLVNDGTLRWDSKVTQYLPDFQLSQPGAAQQTTVADLLSHRVGLAHNAFDRDLERYVGYRELTQKLAAAPLTCRPGTCYAYQNIAFSLIGDIVFASTGAFYSQEVQRRLLKPLGMNDASLGLEGIRASARWARPHVRARGGWASVVPKSTYYEVAPAAGVNASASDMAQWLIAQTGHRPDILSAPLLATLHQPLVATPGQTRSSEWRRQRLGSASYALGWRVYDYSGHRLVYHAGAVQGYRGMIAMLPDQDIGIAVMWNGESALPSGLLPTIIDSAIGLPAHAWLDVDATSRAHLAADSSPLRFGPNSGSAAQRAAAAPN